MPNWTKVPDDWTALDARVAKQRNVQALIAAGLAESRTLADGSQQWRRVPARG